MFEASVEDGMRHMNEYNTTGTLTSRFAYAQLHIANTPKSGSGPSLHYVNAALVAPLPMEPLINSRRPIGMYSSAHPHVFEVHAPRPNTERPIWDNGPILNLEVRRTKGGIERANYALKAMRMIAARARKGTPWIECGKGEPEALLSEYQLLLRVEGGSSYQLLGVHDKMCNHFDLHFNACIQTRTLAQMLDTIESIKDFT